MVKSGIPVPDTIPEGSKAFVICVPDDPFFYGVVAGAIKTMMFRYYWQGTEEQIDEATARMRRMYLEYQEQDGCMICEQIIDCINSDPDTREALVNWFIDAAQNNPLIVQAINEAYNPIAPGQNMPPDVLNESLTPPNPTCDLDLLYGQVSTLIDHMNTNNIDAQEIIESFTNSAERISELVGAIPGIGILPVDEIIDYAQNLWSDDLFEAYAATDTEGYRNELKCALFCLAQDNDCQLTLDIVMNYFAGRLAVNTSDTLSDIIAYLITGTWSGTEVNDLFYFAQTNFMKFGNEFFGTVGLNGFQIYLKLADPDDDWMTVCEDCPSFWTRTYDFVAGEDDWTPVVSGQAQAVYSAGNGYAHGESPTRVGRITLLLDVGYDIDVNSVEIFCTASSISGTTQTISDYINPLYTLVEGQAYAPDVTLATPFTANQIVIDVAASPDPSLDPVPGYLYKIVLTGSGTPPP